MWRKLYLNFSNHLRPTVGKVVLCSFFAIVLGILMPLVTLFGIMMPMPFISIALMMAVVFYVSADLVPVCIFSVISLISSEFMLGVVPGIAATLVWLAPAVLTIEGIRKKRQFFVQIARTVIVSLAATFAALALMASVFGSNMIASAVEMLRTTYDAQKDLFWQMAQPAFANAGAEITLEQFSEAYYSMFRTLQAYYEYHLLANLLSGAMISAVIAVLWGNWLAARRGEATSESFVGLSGWYLPANLTCGMLLVLAAGLVLRKLSIPGAETAWIVVKSLCTYAFMIQTFASMDRKQKAAGAGIGKRAVVIVLPVFLGMMGAGLFGVGFYTLLAILGCMSALFGSKGAARPLIDKYKDQE